MHIDRKTPLITLSLYNVHIFTETGWRGTVGHAVPLLTNYRAQAAELSGEKAESRLRVTGGPGG
jgi:hypothetical protein